MVRVLERRTKKFLAMVTAIATVAAGVFSSGESFLTYAEDDANQSADVIEEMGDDAAASTATDYSKGFTVWFNSDGTTGVEAGAYGDYPISFGSSMSAKANKITVDGTDHYSVQGSANPKTDGANPNGAIPNSGAYIEVTAPADGSITVYGYKSNGKPFYATKSATASDGILLSSSCFDNEVSYTVEVSSGEAWYFYAQGSKAQFVGVSFALPKPTVNVPLTISGNLGDSLITFTNTTTKKTVSVSASDTVVGLQEGYTYTVSVDNANLTLETEEISTVSGVPSSITITVSSAALHAVSGSFKGLPDGASVNSLTFTDEAGTASSAVISGDSYTVSLKNGDYTADAEVTGADGYTVYDHVAVTGTEGEAITDDVWFYGSAKTYSTEYVEKITAGKNGDYATITEAVAAAKAMTRTSDQYVTIELLDDEYVEQVVVNTNNIKMVAASGVTPTIRWYYGIGYKYYSIDSTGYYNEKYANDRYEMKYAQRWGATVRVTGTGFIAEGIDFVNTFNVYVCDEEIGDSAVGSAAEYGQSISGSLESRVSGLDVANTTNVERAAAMAVDADQASFYKCSFISSQDTLYTGSANTYFNGCTITGQTDYIFGNTGCKAVFDNCTLTWLGYTGTSKTGYITATRGTYVFRGCSVTSNQAPGYTVTPGYFGRPWGNTAAVSFIGTTVEDGTICSDGWYSMSGVNPENVAFKEFGNCSGDTLSSDSTKFFYTKYSSDTTTYPAGASTNYFRLSYDEASALVKASATSELLGGWTPANVITSDIDISAVKDWAGSSTSDTTDGSTTDDGTTNDGTTDDSTTDDGTDSEGTDSGSSSSVTYVLEAKDLTGFAKASKADGDEEKAGTDDYFTLIYSAKSAVDSSSKTFEDDYASAQRINFGGAASVSKNAVKITTNYDNAVVTVWWVEGGDDNRQIAILGSDGTQKYVTSETLAKNATCISDLTIEKAGTYYIGGATNNNYIFKIEVTETIPVTETEYVLEAKDLTAFAKASKADGDEEKAGTDDYFTLIYSAKSAVDSSSKTFDDAYASTQRINFGGAASVSKNAVKITTNYDNAVVTIWWAEGGDDNRQIAILGSDGTQKYVTSETLAKNATCISKLTIEKAGTYYIGGATNNNYIFKISVLETSGTAAEKAARADWSKVSAPVISSAVQNGASIDVTVSALVDYDGADKVTVTMYDAAGLEVATKNSSKQSDTHQVSFVPTASGTYSFSAVILREDENAESGYISKETAQKASADFVLPLTAPAVNSLTNKGSGAVEVAWDATPEAEYYIITVDGKETAQASGTTYTLTGLTNGTTYTVGIKAARNDNDKTAVGTTTTITVKNEVQRTWAFTVYGTSTNTSNNGYTGSVNDGNLVVYSESGKGKIVPNSTDGIAFYYTTIDPETENFTLEADITATKWTLSNGQEGFGIMAADTIGVNGSTDTVWNNSVMGIASKVEYYYDGNAVTTDTTASKISMKLGIGSLVRLGVTAEDIANFKKTGTFAYADGTTGSLPENFTTKTTTLETSCGSLGSGTYNIIGNYTTATGTETSDLVTTLHLSIRRDNTGYLVTYSLPDGTVVGQNRIYDLERTALTQIDSDNIYIGFFASRNARISVSNVQLTIVAPEDDEAAETREVKEITANYQIESATVSNSESYDLVYYGNADGKLSIKDSNGNVIADGMDVTANTKYHFDTVTKMGDTVFTITMTPNADYKPGEYEVLDSYESVTFTHTVNRKAFSENYIYVSPSGKSSAAGTKADPTDIYTAVKYVTAGQTIVLAGGEYSLKSTVKTERGIDGTADSMIYMIADPDSTERPVFNFNSACAGMILAGDYWYFQGFDVTKSANAQKGIQVSGNHNTLDGIRTYRNGNTGIQIARYKSTDTKEDWPSYNTILNCTSFLNADAGYEDADGFAAKLTIGDGNVFDGCISAYNADDGWDLYAKAETGAIGKVVIKNCVAFRNGYVLDAEGNEINAGNGNGFKMGGESLSGYHTIINSVAFANKAKGIDSNSCPDIQVYNCTTFDNGSYNVAFYTNNAVNTDYYAEGIVSYRKTGSTEEQIKLKGTQDSTKVYGSSNYYTYGKEDSHNSAGTKVTDSWFENLDTENVVDIAIAQILRGSFGNFGVSSDGIYRNADGTINMNGYLVLTETAATGAGSVMTGTVSKNITLSDSSSGSGSGSSSSGSTSESSTNGSSTSGSSTSGSSTGGSSSDAAAGNTAAGNTEAGNTAAGNTAAGNTEAGNAEAGGNNEGTNDALVSDTDNVSNEDNAGDANSAQTSESSENSADGGAGNGDVTISDEDVAQTDGVVSADSANGDLNVNSQNNNGKTFPWAAVVTVTVILGAAVAAVFVIRRKRGM